MNIAIIGYGKMGHMIEEVARQRGHNIVCIIDADNLQDFDSAAFRSADAAIEFTTPATAVDNIRRAWQQGVPVVSGTTGWNNMLPTLKNEAEKQGKGLFWTSNFSLGVNAVMAINRRLAEILHSNDDYDISVTEIHHIHKKDKPSGTAISLAEDIVERTDRLKEWRLEENIDNPLTQLPIISVREGEVPGTHIIVYDSDVDTVSITHKAKSRKGFALGAVIAAEFMQGKTGFHNMRELVG